MAFSRCTSFPISNFYRFECAVCTLHRPQTLDRGDKVLLSFGIWILINIWLWRWPSMCIEFLGSCLSLRVIRYGAGHRRVYIYSRSRASSADFICILLSFGWFSSKKKRIVNNIEIHFLHGDKVISLNGMAINYATFNGTVYYRHFLRSLIINLNSFVCSTLLSSLWYQIVWQQTKHDTQPIWLVSSDTWN